MRIGGVGMLRMPDMRSTDELAATRHQLRKQKRGDIHTLIKSLQQDYSGVSEHKNVHISVKQSVYNTRKAQFFRVLVTALWCSCKPARSLDHNRVQDSTAQGKPGEEVELSISRGRFSLAKSPASSSTWLILRRQLHIRISRMSFMIIQDQRVNRFENDFLTFVI